MVFNHLLLDIHIDLSYFAADIATFDLFDCMNFAQFNICINKNSTSGLTGSKSKLRS